MGSSAELTLGRPCHGAEHAAFGGAHATRMVKLEYYLKTLEDERKKIEAFKRELPFCMQLLNDEIEASKEQLADYEELSPTPPSTLPSPIRESFCGKGDNVAPVLEEFLPTKKLIDCIKDDASKNAASEHLTGSGVIQTQFWTPAEAYAHGQEMVTSMTDKPYKKRDRMRIEDEEGAEGGKPVLDPQKRRGAFLPFCASRKPLSAENLMAALPHLRDKDASPAPRADMQEIAGGHYHRGVKESHTVVRVTVPAASYSNCAGQATQRKPRRCWSPELHRRFVNALQQLGGSEVATPKQIRELMKIDGLTNDEVKSHLQKYRLHTRRPSASFHGTSAGVPQVVVLGGIWVPPEVTFAGHASDAACAAMAQPDSAERQATRGEASPCCAEEERCIQLSTGVRTPLQLQPALYAFNGGVRAQWQGSSQEPLQRLSSSAQSSEAESEEGNDGYGGWKHESRSMQVDESGDDLLHGVPLLHARKWAYTENTRSPHESTGEDDSEAEEGRVYETLT